ncbi:hypothetical protein FACS1894126_1460 [Alphaproteobacteria bacterium]|nr:hypothetical protein FACS1894126_1460 [Alphaproteobacteria bacterium]
MKCFLFLLSVILFGENLNAANSCMVLGFVDESGANQSSVGFHKAADDIDISIFCRESVFSRLDAETRKGFLKIGDEFCYSRLNLEYKGVVDVFPENQKLVGEGIPIDMSVAELSEIVKTQKVIFYTGAGISAGAVPTMDALIKDFGLSSVNDKKMEPQDYIANVTKNPNYYIEIMRGFFDRCETAQPTVAHVELAKIIDSYNNSLVTENLDKLHQKTGIDPMLFPGEFENRENLESGGVMNANFVITIGLNTDEGGFLKWYKECNPTGKIISINLNDTCYLSANDFSMKGDAQQIMKQLGELL